MSLRPTVFVLSGFLSDAECDFIKSYASSRMVSHARRAGGGGDAGV